MTWTYGPDLPYKIYYGASVQWKETFIIVGGSSTEFIDTSDTLYVFDAEKNEWNRLNQTLNIGRIWTAALMVPDDFCREV